MRQRGGRRLGVAGLAVAVVAVAALAASPPQRLSPIYDVALDTNDTHHLYWRLDPHARQVRLEVHTTGEAVRPWLALGFSDRGELVGADMCVLWTDWRGRLHLQNALVGLDGRLRVAERQLCGGFQHKVRGDVIKFTFTRDYNTCDPDHYVIQEGTTQLVWSWGEGPLYRLAGVRAAGKQSGVVRVQLLKPDLPPPADLSKNVKVLEVRSQRVQVPARDTTYWCTVVKLGPQFSQKHHVLQFAPVIEAANRDVVHHMEVFHCVLPPDAPVPSYQGDCHAPDRPREVNVCRKVLAAWAMGASAFTYPEEAGLAIGGADFNPHVMLEVHYNNPALLSGRVDSSGMALHYTPHLRAHDAGIMELGLEYTPKMAVPPRSTSFTLSGYCVPECTALGVPEEGIYIFGSQLHTHLTGVRVATQHFRRGTQLADLNHDNHYSTHFQEIRRLPAPVHVLPGDSLVTSCEYKTTERENVTLGGFSIRDEMCVNYVHYYPRVELEVCKSSVDSATLSDYFTFLQRWELQNTSTVAGWTENYRAIEWTPLRTAMLNDLYLHAPLSMQCNRSSGDRFPGYWENIPIPQVLHPLPPPPEPCHQPRRASAEDQEQLEEQEAVEKNEEVFLK